MTEQITAFFGNLRFTPEDSDRAFDAWRFNCGPGALCAVLGMTPDEIRPHLGDFQTKGYTNPTLMFEILRRLNVPYKVLYRGDTPDVWQPIPTLGLMRVQWAGPWTKPGVPMAARYRHTHWVGAWHDGCEQKIFDINALCAAKWLPLWAGGWLPLEEWSTQLVPWLLEECAPRATGEWWITHAIKIEGGVARG